MPDRIVCRLTVFGVLLVHGFFASAAVSVGAAEPAAAKEEALLELTGRVADALGAPLADVEINAVALSRRPSDDPLSGGTIAKVEGHAKTDAAGAFNMRVRSTSQPDDIALELFAYKEGHGLGAVYLEMGRDHRDVFVKLPVESKIKGTLLGPSGLPLAGASLTIATLTIPDGDSQSAPFSQLPRGMTAWPKPQRTDSRGEFVVEGTYAGTTAHLEVDDERAARQRWPCESAGEQRLTLRCGAPRVVVGRVIVGESGEPVADARVGLTSFGQDGRYLGSVSATIDDQGSFTLRPYLGARLSIRLSSAAYPRMVREIPWPAGTETQRMTLPLYSPSHAVLDETTADGSPASTIDQDYPASEVEVRRPSEPLAATMAGTIIVGGAIRASGDAEAIKGLFAIDPNTGEWRMLVGGGSFGRVSRDGKLLAYTKDSPDRCHLYVAPVSSDAQPAQLAEQTSGPACWLTADALAATLRNPARREYWGQKYWGQESEKRRMGIDGTRRAAIPLPALHEIWDASADGQWLALHWDTHAITGSQLYVARVDGTELRAIARKRQQYYWHPRFSPDGGRVVAKHLDPLTQVQSIRVLTLNDASEVAIRLKDDSLPAEACWSPDGKSIAITESVRSHDGAAVGGKLLVVDADGSGIREIRLVGAAEVFVQAGLDWTAAQLSVSPQ